MKEISVDRLLKKKIVPDLKSAMLYFDQQIQQRRSWKNYTDRLKRNRSRACRPLRSKLQNSLDDHELNEYISNLL